MKSLFQFYCVVCRRLFFVLVFALVFILAHRQLLAQEIHAKLITTQSDDGAVVFSVTNSEVVPVYIAVQLTEMDGFALDRTDPIVIPLETGENEAILTLSPQENARRQSYRISYHFLFVNPDEVKPDGFLYYLPFAHGVKHTITQGWNGSFSHGGQNTYAVDFDLAEGEEVYAARDGVVVAVKEDSRIGGMSPQYSKYANYILIRHADNTIASYVHLKVNGAVVRVGQRVAVGEHIGYAGKTGLASGPHLHFDVRAATFTQGMQSIKFNFRDKDGAPVQPQAYTTYYGRFPGGKDFVELRGRDITLDTFQSHNVDVPKDARFKALHIRKETYDSVVVLFIANAFSYAVQASVKLNLGNLRTEQKMPIELVIPARKEVFLGIAHVQNAFQPIAVRSSIRYTRKQD